ncbi:hypothetical protein MKW92_031508 [Papaver armeniacum]|nr:hypothetical protein MKW92_031508 [Papaver armeniacum]
MEMNGIPRPSEISLPPTLPLPVDGVNPICGTGNSYVPAPLHWKKAAEALQCSHFDEVRKMLSQFKQAQVVNLQGTSLTVAQVAAIARRPDVKVRLDKVVAHDRVSKSAKWVSDKIAPGTADKTADLQTELIRFLNAGVIGKEFLPTSYSKIAMLVRTNTLMQGYSGIRWEVLEGMSKLMNENLIPKMPLRGTVSASGDAVLLSYVAGLLTGRHNSQVMTPEGDVITSLKALKRAGIPAPFELQAKEGLALVNGTAVGSAVAATVCFDANILVLLSEVLSALFCEVMHGNSEFTDPLTHELKHHPGQIEAAAIMEFLLDESDFMKQAEIKKKEKGVWPKICWI